MKALNFVIFFLAALTVSVSWARPVAPTGDINSFQVEEVVNKTDSTASDQGGWEKVTKTLKTWWKQAKDEVFGTEEEQRAERQRELVEQLPSFITEDKGVDEKEIQRVQKSLKDGRATTIVDQGQEADKDLKKNEFGVPTVEVSMKDIPRLNVGVERRIQAKDFYLPKFNWVQLMAQNADPLSSPKAVNSVEVQNHLNQQIAEVKDHKDPHKDLKFNSKLVTLESIEKAQPLLLKDVNLAIQPYRELSIPELKMLTAVILFKQGGNCEYVIGLFDQLRKEKGLKKESEFHLGACAQEMKLYTTAYKYLSKLIKEENPAYTEAALKILGDGVQADKEQEFAKLVMGLKNKSYITNEIQDAVFYRVAKGAYQAGNPKVAKIHAEKVSAKSKYYLEARYLTAVSNYALGNLPVAENLLEGLRNHMLKTGEGGKNLRSLSAINLARIKFMKNEFTQSLQLYNKVDKDHALWVQGLIEQGWAQLMVDDFAGAIGNMYSLHSPYFKTVYKPESYVVRTIGYLNICQYGDAYKTLTKLEKRYRPWLAKVEKYIDSNKLAKNYFETVKGYLSGKSTHGVDGLPYQVIREMARQKDYLNSQIALNNKIDEEGRYNGVDTTIRKEKAKLKWRMGKAKERFAQIKANLRKAKADSSLAKHVNQWKGQLRQERDVIVGYKYLLGMLELGRRGFHDLKKRSLAEIDKEKYNLREEAGRALVKHLYKIRSEVAKVLDNNEFLRYEVFAGSGQNIRYQVAGGNVGEKQRLPASVKPDKSLNWTFDGEYWEDEIGSYRSSLKNNCPSMGQTNSAVQRKNES